ncbi:hypothetical protein GS461_08965 [Rhodococcus hoagii]|nr:hypothetical protein [Prescottella equi]
MIDGGSALFGEVPAGRLLDEKWDEFANPAVDEAGVDAADYALDLGRSDRGSSDRQAVDDRSI